MEGLAREYRHRQEPERRAELLFDPEEIARLRADWDALYLRSDRPFLSQSFEWNWCAWKAYVMPRGGRPCCAIVRENGHLRLVWPLAVTRHRGPWLLATAPAPSECTDPLIEPGADSRSLAEAACDRIWAEIGADLIYIDFVRTGTAAHAALLSKRPFWTHTVESFAAEWEGHSRWESYHASISRGLRGQIESRRRRLSACGDLRFEQVRSRPEQERVIRWILEQKARWLDGKGRKSACVGTREYEQFLLAAPGMVQSMGTVAIFHLALGGETIAAEYHLLNEWRLDCIVAAYSKQHEKLSPGHVLRRHVMEWAFRHGIAYNFGPGRDRYKEALSNRITEFADMRFARSFRGRLFVLMKKGKAALSWPAVPRPLGRLLSLGGGWSASQARPSR